MTKDTPISTRALEQLVYHAVMEFAPWPMAEVEGKAHVVQAVNPSFCALLEKSEEELLGKPIAQLFKEGHATHGLLDRVQLSGEAATHVETANNTPGPIYWSYTCWPLQAKDARHVGLMIQVTETSKVDQQTKDMNEALLISAVQQHELTDVAEQLNARLNNEMAARKELDDALRESQRFLRSSLDALSGHLAVVDASGTILEVNEAWHRFADDNGYPNADHGVGSKYLQGLVVPETVEPDYAQGINDVLAGRRNGFELEYPCHSPTAQRWFLMRVTRFSSPGPVRVLIIHDNITERKQAELALRETQERFRTAAYAAQLTYVEMDLVKGGAHTAENFEAVMGYPSPPEQEVDAAIGVRALLEHVVANDRARVEAALQKFVTGGPVGKIEYRVLGDDGIERWIESEWVLQRDATGQPVKTFATNINITERKQAEVALRESEEYNRSITDSSPDCIKTLDLDGNLLSMAERGQKLLCIPDIAPYLNQPWVEFYEGAADRAAAIAAVKTAASGGEGNFIGFFANLRGEPKWWDVRISPILDASGKPLKLLAVSRDVTESKRTELALEATAKDLAEVDRRKSEFLATLAHELRNPLAPLRNGLELLSMADHDRATGDQAHGMMKRQLDQMVRLIDELMDLSRISRGTVDLRLERVDLRAVLEQAVEASKPLIEHQNHSLVVDLPDEPVMVDGDSMRLIQVFSNLLNNAAKYTDNGGAIAVHLDVDGNEARVTVDDNGIGIAANQQGKVFDMFAQVERTNDRVQGGLGIGLNIVKHLVGMHGGSIAVRSEGLGKGSSFTVRLPLSAERERKSSVIDTSEAVKTIAPQRILIVDDNVDAAAMMALLLGKMGHELRVANNGEEALAVGAELLPDVVLMDLGMPIMDGFSACRLMRKTPWGAKALIVALSGWGQDEDRRKTTEAGFDHHLVKPARREDLMNTLAAADLKQKGLAQTRRMQFPPPRSGKAEGNDPTIGTTLTTPQP